MKYLVIFLLFFTAIRSEEIPNFFLGGGSEISVAINPTNPKNIVIGANLKGLWYTNDGGETWISSSISSKYGVWGDPALEFDAEGNLYYSHLSNADFWLDRIVVQKSTDGGITWVEDEGLGFNNQTQHDKEWIVADMNEKSPHFGDLYVTWTEFDSYGSDLPEDSTRILFSRSSSSGEFWSDAIVISDSSGNCIDDDETVEGAVPCIGPSGEIYVSWAGPLGIMFDKSLDGGYSFGKDIFATNQISGWNYDIPNYKRCNGLPVTSCDLSHSEYRGRIYILYSDQVSNDNTNVYIIKSDDKGETWSNPIDVTGVQEESHQFMAWMDIDDLTGYIYVAYYDNRNYPNNNMSDIYLATSKDGGASFQNIKLNEYSITPQKSTFMGDYLGIDVYNGHVWIAWTSSPDGLRTNAIAANYSDLCSTQDDSISKIKLKQYPNPTGSISNIEFTLEETSFVRLYIENLQGEIIDNPIEKKMEPGKHTYTYDTSQIGSGVYFYRLEYSGKTVRQKCCVIK